MPRLLRRHPSPHTHTHTHHATTGCFTPAQQATHQDFLRDIGAFMRSITPLHLISAGTEGFFVEDRQSMMHYYNPGGGGMGGGGVQFGGDGGDGGVCEWEGVPSKARADRNLPCVSMLQYCNPCGCGVRVGGCMRCRQLQGEAREQPYFNVASMHGHTVKDSCSLPSTYSCQQRSSDSVGVVL